MTYAYFNFWKTEHIKVIPLMKEIDQECDSKIYNLNIPNIISIFSHTTNSYYLCANYISRTAYHNHELQNRDIIVFYELIIQYHGYKLQMILLFFIYFRAWLIEIFWLCVGRNKCCSRRFSIRKFHSDKFVSVPKILYGQLLSCTIWWQI